MNKNSKEKLSFSQIEYLEKLCRIELSLEEKEKFRKDLSAILEWADQMNKVDTSKIESISQITGLSNVVREDEKQFKTREEKKEMREKILENALERKNGFFKTKVIL